MEFLPPIPLIKRNWTGTTDGLVKDRGWDITNKVNELQKDFL
mgnify:FL=1